MLRLLTHWGALSSIVVTLLCAAGAVGCGSSAEPTTACPSFDAIEATTIEPWIGMTIELRARTGRVDRAPASLRYLWTATGGTLSDPTVPTPTFSCSAPGDVQIALTVSDRDPAVPCSETVNLSLTCRSPASISELGHLVVIYLENRSFDQLYGSYAGAEGLSSPGANIAQLDAKGRAYDVLPFSEGGLTLNLANAPFDMTRFVSPHLPTSDPIHRFFQEQLQINGGKMDRFVAFGTAGASTVGHYPTAALPIAQLAKAMPTQSTLCDRFFHAAFGGSFLNHFWLIAAATPVFPNAPPWRTAGTDPDGNLIDGEVTPDGFAVNTLVSITPPHPVDTPDQEMLPLQTSATIGDRLNDAGVDWAWYAAGWRDALVGNPVPGYSYHHQPFAYFANYADSTPLRARHLQDEKDFLAAVAAGSLPAVSFVKPTWPNTEHPGSADLMDGEDHTVSLIRSLVNSPLWKDTVVIVTYDENGGFWDHVAPPVDDRWGPGTRVPALVFSPFAKGGVDSTTYDTTAILKLIEKRWSLPALTSRDAAQEDMSIHAMSFAPSNETSRATPMAECRREPDAGASATTSPVVSIDQSFVAESPVGPRRTLDNPFAYIPPQCYAKTREPGRGASNPCSTCHQGSSPPNFSDDAELQLRFQFPPGGRVNRWSNVVTRAAGSSDHATDPEILAYVRESNYFNDRGAITLAQRLDRLPSAWDSEGDGHWDGFVPDAWFRFDDSGFDVDREGRETGWRAFAYYPVPGMFLPTNGSMDDVLIRLDPSLREDDGGRPDRRIYEINLAIVEALITRRDVPIEAAAESALSVDLDLDGTIGIAHRVAFDASPNGETRMRYVGRRRTPSARQPFPIGPGLFPLGTEFLHSVRYLDVSSVGDIVMAPRMKELRYAKKINWLHWGDLRALAANEAVERRSATGAREVLTRFDRGVDNGQGWLLQGFIESTDGSLRPESYEESVPCAGCHGGVGSTTDSMFAFPRKIDARGLQRGWFHWTRHGARGLADPLRSDGLPEYTRYLLQNGAGDDFGENTEIRDKFFDERGHVRPEKLARLRDDIAELLLPSAARALDLDRAYRAIVAEQSFTRGRDVVLGARANVYDVVPLGETTGVRVPVSGGLLVPPSAALR